MKALDEASPAPLAAIPDTTKMRGLVTAVDVTVDVTNGT